VDRPRARRIDPARLAVALATSRWVPPPVLLGLLRASVGLLRRRIRQQDRRQDARRPAGAPAVYCIDGYHGGITFWDWLALPQGGFWYEYCWNLVGRLLIDRALARPSLHTIFDIDGHTFEQMARKRPQDIARLAQAAQAGAIEVVNGTYGQPLSLTVGGEAIVRHFYYGLRAIEEAIGVRVDSFLSQEPLFFPQMPQVLAGFGFRRAVLRTHWAPFGSEAGVDADVVRWRGPDGSETPTAPRYAFTDYGWLRPDHRGLEKGGLTGGDLARWGRDQLDGLRRRAEMHGVTRPLLSRVADFHVVDPARPDAPLANAHALVGQGARFVTVREYFQEAGEAGETVAWDVDDMPSTIPWGLGAELLQRARTEAEGDLLAAERLDAIASALGMPSQAARLDDAWKNLLHAQHHDLHVCGPWHSRPHAKSMAEVGADLAWLAAQGARAVALTSQAYLAARVDTSGAGEQPLLVFNPAPWPRREFIPPAGRVVDLPALGYRTVRPTSGGDETPQEEPCSLEANPDGTFALLAEGKPLTTGGHLTVWRDGRWHDSREAVASVQTLEDRPGARRFLVEGRIADIPFRQWATLDLGLPRLEFRLELDFGPEAYLGPQLEDGRPGTPYYVDDARKLCLNFATSSNRAVVPSPFLMSESAGDRLIGLPGLFLEDENGGGLAFLNRGTPGYHLDRRAGVLRNVLAWGPREWLYASDDSLTYGRSRYLALRGRHAYECAVSPCSSRLEALRASLGYQLPCLAMAVEASVGPLPPVGSFLAVEPEGIVLTALFGQNGGIYARLWNSSAQEQEASLGSGGEGLRLRPVTLDLREEGGPANAVTLRPWGIQTVLIEGLGTATVAAEEET
jgi:hypothetical protein